MPSSFQRYARLRVIVRKIYSGIPICTVFFSHGSPGALAKIRTPAMPIGLTSVIFYQATLFRVGGHAQVARAKSVHQDTFVPWLFWPDNPRRNSADMARWARPFRCYPRDW